MFNKATLNINHLRDNVGVLKKVAPKSKILAYVKNNAYGHGDETIVSALNDVDGFGVTDLSSALKIRSIFADKRILLATPLDEEGLFAASNNDLDIMVADHNTVEIILNKKIKLNMWVKVNTGFNRFGFMPNEVDSIVSKLEHLSPSPIILMTHFMNQFVVNDSHHQQLKLWENIIKNSPLPYSHANSAMILNPELNFGEWIRPGLMLYTPPRMKDLELGLKTVLTLKVPILSIMSVKKEECVGYNQSYRFPKATRLAQINVGYGDGYPLTHDSLPVFCKGHKLHTVGRCTMDFTAIDIQDYDIKVGDMVEIMGENILPIQLANQLNAIPYQILTNLKLDKWLKETIYEPA